MVTLTANAVDLRFPILSLKRAGNPCSPEYEKSAEVNARGHPPSYGAIYYTLHTETTNVTFLHRIWTVECFS